jgi:hypothetical protein
MAKRQIPAKEYLKSHPQPVILHFQPRAFVAMETPEQLREWEKLVREHVGLDVLANDDSGSYTQTLSAPPPGAFEIPDDCEAD